MSRPAPARRVALAAVGWIAALAAPALADPGATGAIEPRRTEGRFEHAALDSVLRRVVHGPLVDYATLSEDRAALDRYLAAVAGARPEQLPARADSLAFYLNAYNALTLGLVAERYPEIEGVLEVEAEGEDGGSVGFFEQPVTVGGERSSLDRIEHEILRPRFQEPRIHFAINCASISCPPLRRRAYDPERLEAQLDRATSEFLSNPSRNRYDAAAGVLRLSQLFEWFEEDFERAAGSAAAFVAPYLNEPGLDRRLAQKKRPVEIEYLRYDWSLNDTGPAPRRGG